MPQLMTTQEQLQQLQQQMFMQNIARPFAGLQNRNLQVPQDTEVETPAAADRVGSAKCPTPPPLSPKPQGQPENIRQPQDFLTFMLHRLQTCKDMEDASEFADNITALTKEHHCATQLLQAFVKALCEKIL